LRQERRAAYARYWLACNRFTHQFYTVYRAVQKLEAPPGSSKDQPLDSKDQQAQVAPAVVEQSSVVTLEWREAADALLLIGGEAVVDAANAHIKAMEQRIEDAWKGEWSDHPRAYKRLNDAMRHDLLEPTEP
jgi:hypothetical protein